MKPLLDFIPLLAFFIAYKLADIYVAAGVLIGVTSLQYIGLYWYYKKLQRSELLTWAAVVIFCSITLLLHDETILKWKAPVIYWCLALSFLITPWITGQTLVEKMLGKAVQLASHQWRQLNFAWVIFFTVAGLANAYVAFYHPSIWVDFKVFGSLGMTLLFVLAQGIFLYRHMTPVDPSAPVAVSVKIAENSIVTSSITTNSSAINPEGKPRDSAD